ncbi:alpha/beta hydrolase family protein [Aldersonia sp. NBC_00410]|uniref:alpha/beta hydrolase n=1 Tax=Aldersonia sp. NBC_00410 TaxID=2975954 RepID=UPI002B1DABB5|nr:alpha/beta hydrolase family protein [Aldersonia sp. NBC_00410]
MTTAFAIGWLLTGVGTAAADPVIDSGKLFAFATSADGSYVEDVKVEDDRNLTIDVHSTAMNVTVPVMVYRPKDTSAPRPTLYLLNGAGGGVDAATWKKQTNIYDFLADKNANVVTPVGGAWSYYTDWKQADPKLGLNKWKTFLTEELPPIVDAGLGTNRTSGIAGISSSGTSVFNLAESKPGFYKAVASYSGCAQTADPVGQEFVRLTVETGGGGNTLNMYGPPNDPMWAANDPVIHADKLRNTALYISTGNGLPGVHEQFGAPHALPGALVAYQMAVGGTIEAAVNYCTNNMANRLNQLGIPATYNFRNTGTHSWGYWEDDFKNSWPVIARGLGI